MSREKRLEKLVVELEAKTAKYKADLNKAQRQTRKFSKNTKKDFLDLRQAFGLIGAGFAVNSIIQATAKQEKAFAQLQQGIVSTSKAAGFGAQELASYASKLQSMTTFGDEDIISAMSQLVTFTNITGEEFKRTTQAALDLSTRMDGDLKGSVVQLGKALNDPVANLSALSRSGIQFTDAQKGMIKTLVDGGNAAEAQRVILSELERQFGGSAAAARDTFGGSIEALSNAFGDLLESEGGLNAAKTSIEELTETLSDPAVKEGVNQLTGAIISGFAGAASFIARVTNSIKFLAEEFAAWINGPAVGDLPRINEELEEVNAKIAAIEETASRSRSNAGDRTLQILEARKNTLEQILALSNEVNVVTSTGGQVNITAPPDQAPNYGFDSGFNNMPQRPELLEEWAFKYDELANSGSAAAEQIRSAWLESLDQVTVSMSRMLAQGIIEGEELGQVFENIGKSLVTELLAALIQVGVQMAVNKAFSSSASVAEVAQASVTGPAIAAAFAPAAAMASLATLGSNAIPAAAAVSSTVALSSSLALAGMAHDGISNVPKEGTWLLDKGERVLSSKQNADLKQFMNGGGASVTQVFNVSAGVAGTVQAEIMRAMPAIEKMAINGVESAMRAGGSTSKAAGVR